MEPGGVHTLANPADNPANTLPGLDTSGVTLELGGIWDPTVLAAIPGPTGILCGLELSQPANVSVTANVVRGGVVSAFSGITLQPVFTGGPVGPLMVSATLQNGMMTVLFHGGELQTATSVNGPWVGTGDRSGAHTEPIGTSPMRFYRVSSP